MNNQTPVKNFTDLQVYQETYRASIEVITKIIPKLPIEERFDLADQLRRSTKAVPRLIAEGYSKRHQKKGFQGLIDTALEESNETIVSLNHVKDIYKIEIQLCEQLIELYDKASRGIYKLALAWSNFKERRFNAT